MPRARLSVDTVLSTINSEVGDGLGKTAGRFVELAVRLGAQPWPRQKGVALRLPGKLGAKPEWLTLFVISTAGTIYNNWHDRWRGADVSAKEIDAFERAMITIFGRGFVSNPSAYQSAASIAAAEKQWAAAERAVQKAVKAIRGAVDHRSGRKRSDVVEPVVSSLSALEGQLTETRVARRSRNAKLRRAALLEAAGKCAACQTDFGALLGGRGRRVLQVHHRRQMSDRDQPEWTDVDDLDVVCANCHLMIHADRDAPLPAEALRALLRAV